jgi:tetratricopeptide (TPR) repeat protein
LHGDEGIQPEGSFAIVNINPLKIFREACKKFPALNAAWGVIGLVAVVAIVKGLRIGWAEAYYGSAIVMVFMVAMVVFARLIIMKPGDFKLPAKVFMWFCLGLTMLTASALFFGMCFDWSAKNLPGLFKFTRTSAGTYLVGQTYENNAGGTALPGVEVDAAAITNAQADAHGRFRLDFPGMPPESIVKISASLPGYNLLSWYGLRDYTLLSKPEAGPLCVVMCRESEYPARVQAQGQAEIADNYRRDESRLPADPAGRVERINLSASRNLADSALASLPPPPPAERAGSVSALAQTALEQHAAGNTAGAIQTLGDDALAQAVQAARDRHDPRALAEAAENYILKARLLVLQLRFAEAGGNLLAAVSVTPDDFTNNFICASFNQALNRRTAAVAGFEQCLAIARKAGLEAGAASALNNLGILKKDLADLPAARACFEQALDIRLRLAAQNPDTYFPDAAISWNDLGLLEKHQNPEAAQADFERALDIFQGLAAHDPDAYWRDLAATYNNLGWLARQQQQTAQAETNFQQALTILRQVAPTNQALALPDLAETLNNLGLLRKDAGNPEAARDFFNMALTNLASAGTEPPDAGLREKAVTLKNLAYLFQSQNQPDAARNCILSAIEIYRPMAQQKPDVFLPDLALSLMTLGDLDWDAAHLPAAGPAYEESLSIRRDLAAHNPAVELPELAQILVRLGHWHQRQNQPLLARDLYEEARMIYGNLSQLSPGQYDGRIRDLADHLRQLDQ